MQIGQQLNLCFVSLILYNYFLSGRGDGLDGPWVGRGGTGGGEGEGEAREGCQRDTGRGPGNICILLFQVQSQVSWAGYEVHRKIVWDTLMKISNQLRGPLVPLGGLQPRSEDLREGPLGLLWKCRCLARDCNWCLCVSVVGHDMVAGCANCKIIAPPIKNSLHRNTKDFGERAHRQTVSI